MLKIMEIEFLTRFLTSPILLSFMGLCRDVGTRLPPHSVINVVPTLLQAMVVPVTQLTARIRSGGISCGALKKDDESVDMWTSCGTTCCTNAVLRKPFSGVESWPEFLTELINALN